MLKKVAVEIWSTQIFKIQCYVRYRLHVFNNIPSIFWTFISWCLLFLRFWSIILSFLSSSISFSDSICSSSHTGSNLLCLITGVPSKNLLHCTPMVTVFGLSLRSTCKAEMKHKLYSLTLSDVCVSVGERQDYAKTCCIISERLCIFYCVITCGLNYKENGNLNSI